MTLFRASLFSSAFAFLFVVAGAACGGGTDSCLSGQCGDGSDASSPDATANDAASSDDASTNDAGQTDAIASDGSPSDAADDAEDAGCTGTDSCDQTHLCPTSEKCCATLPNQCGVCMHVTVCPP